MSHKQLINMIYNPSSLCMIRSDDSNLTTSQQTVASSQGSQESLQVISDIVQAKKNPKAVIRSLKKLKHLIHDDIPLSFRPELFKEMNQVVKVLQQHYPDSRDVFSAAFHAITSLKEQIDNAPQTSGSLSELEWVKLEKAVYLLCNWEDEIDAARS